MPPKREPNQQPKHVTDDPTHPNFFFHSNTLEKSRNDPAPVQAALSRLKVDDPSTFGGVSSASMSSSSAAPRLDSFTVHGPPDVSKDTHVIAVLGIEQKWASPRDDGWFLSDFLAFWHLLNGVTNSQAWLHCLDLEKCVEQHERYLHGSPFKERKVILDKAILQNVKAAKHAPQRVWGMEIKKAFTTTVMNECKTAHENKRNVLILMFGHGDSRHNGIDIGELIMKTLKIKDLKKNLKGFSDARITILSTACFSGGWSCIPDLGDVTSTMMAAGKEKPSKSWNYSFSYGRASGSMFTTAVVSKLTSLSPGISLLEAAEDENYPVEKREAQEGTYGDFCSTIFEALLRDIDRRGLEHEITFSAQGDSWNSCFSQRVGIPLEDFKARWEALPVFPQDTRMHPGNWTNRDPHVGSQAAKEYMEIRSKATVTGSEAMATEASGTVLGKRKTSALYGGEPNALLRQVSRVGQEYLNSYTGFDDSGDDGALHNLLHRIIHGLETDEAQLERAWLNIRYRMDQMSIADRYVEALGIQPPLGQQCHEWDSYRHSYKEKSKSDERYNIKRMIFDDYGVLFSSPSEDQGRPFYKGIDYVVAAIQQSGLSKPQMQAKLKELEKLVDAEVEGQKDFVRKDPEVSSKRQKLFQLYGKVLRSVSPSKRRSRGLSLTASV